MKVILNIIAILFIIILLIACGNKAEDNNRSDKALASLEAKAKEDVSDQPGDKQIAVAKKLISSADTDKVNTVDAKKMFKNYCAICHGRKGNMTINGAKDLTQSKSSLEQRVAKIYFGKGTMTPFKGMIENEEIVAVAKYLEELRK